MDSYRMVETGTNGQRTALWVPTRFEGVAVRETLDSALLAYWQENVGWMQGGTALAPPTDTEAYNRATLLSTLDVMYRRQGLPRHILRLYVIHTIGDGVAVTFPDDEAMQEQWDTWAELRDVRFRRKLQSAMTRRYLYGTFGWWIADRRRNDWTRNRIRTVWPHNITEIEMDADNEETLARIEVNRTRLDPANVFLWRHDPPDGSAWGTSVLEPVITPLKKYEMAVNNWDGVAALRSRLPVIHKTPHRNPASAKLGTTELPPRLTMLHCGPDDVFEFPSANLGSGDHEQLCQEWLKQVAAGTGWPSYMLSSDSRVQTYASTLVIEGPALKMCQALQREAELEIADAVRWIIGSDDVYVEVSLPDLQSRNAKDQIEADVLMLDRQVISRETMRERQGIDNIVEQERIDNERSADAGYGGPPLPRSLPAPSPTPQPQPAGAEA